MKTSEYVLSYSGSPEQTFCIEKNFIHSEIHQSCLRDLVVYFKIHVVPYMLMFC